MTTRPHSPGCVWRSVNAHHQSGVCAVLVILHISTKTSTFLYSHTLQLLLLLLLYSKWLLQLEYIMNYLQQLKRIRDLTSELVTDMVLNNPSFDETSIQLIKHRQELDKIIDALVECDAGDDNA